MRRRFEQAISDVGGFARIPGQDGGFVVLSLQPCGSAGEDITEIGTGFFHRYRAYIAYDASSAGLKDGDSLIYKERRYIIRHIEPVDFGGETMYFKGILFREEGA